VEEDHLCQLDDNQGGSVRHTTLKFSSWTTPRRRQRVVEELPRTMSGCPPADNVNRAIVVKMSLLSEATLANPYPISRTPHHPEGHSPSPRCQEDGDQAAPCLAGGRGHACRTYLWKEGVDSPPPLFRPCDPVGRAMRRPIGT
jgi:hypothetical protein